MTAPGAIIDMHMHTRLGASDSSLAPEVLADEARRLGLTGVNITEHDRLWDRYTLNQFRTEQAPLFVNNGMEVTTDMGHIIAVGLKTYASGIRRLAELRRIADDTGAYIIAAHPFRYHYEPVFYMRKGIEPIDMVAETLAQMPLFEHVHAIEALNGANNERENVIALQVAAVLGKPVTGGSDCHSNHGIGYYCTLFDDPIESEEDLLAALHAGRFHAGHGLAQGSLVPFTDTSLGDAAAAK